MKEKFCEFERVILKGLRSSTNPDREHAAHLAQCAGCREAVKVAGWMQAFAAAGPGPKALPKPGFIKWKAQLVEKQAAAERATRPILWAQGATVVLVFTAVFWALFSDQPRMAPTAKVLSDSLELIAAPLLVGSICAVFVCLVFAYKWREPSKRK